MAITLSTGATIAIAKTYGAVVSITAVTNSVAAGANATTTMTSSAAHSLVSGDWIEINSGWGRLDKRLARCTTGTTASTIVLEAIDTYDTSKHPTGTGTGTVRKVAAWSTLSQVKAVSASGGSQNYASITDIADVVERQVPTTRAAVTMTVDVYDDPTLAWYADVSAADAARTPYGLLMTFPNGSKLGTTAYWSLMKVPTLSHNEALMSQISLAYAAEPTRYAS